MGWFDELNLTFIKIDKIFGGIYINNGLLLIMNSLLHHLNNFVEENF